MRRVIPDLTLRTSFIVGFPGRPSRNSKSCAISSAKLNLTGWERFRYSDQEGAGAYGLDRSFRLREIERRRKHLMGIQRQISKKKKKALVGQEFDLLLEGSRKRPICSWKAAPRCMHQKLTAKSS